ncbi:MAG: heme o synthase [Acidimicrobiia bacterium]
MHASPAVETHSTRLPWYRTIVAYFRLTKPRVIELLLVTTVPAMVLAADGRPSPLLVIAVLIGGAMAAGGANTVNCFLERDRDQLMRRTHTRPLPAGDIDPRAALAFGLVLEAVAFAWLWWSANLLAASLAVGAMVFYVFVYTMWLKPRTPQNIVIGGAAGAVPALVGWAAVTGSLSWAAWIMFAIVFCWTPPHFWALAIRYREDYARAEIPMMPVVRGPRRAAMEGFVYSIIVVALSVALPAVSTLGAVYLVSACVLGAVFLVQAFRLIAHNDERRAMQFFTLSNMYLALLFVAIAVDAFLARA